MQTIKYSFSAYRKPRTLPAAFYRVVVPFVLGIISAAIGIAIIAVLSHDATAAQNNGKDAYVKALEKTLAKCLSGGDQPIQIGNEIWVCGATNTGVKAL